MPVGPFSAISPYSYLLAKKSVNFLRLFHVRVYDVGSLVTSLNPDVQLEPAKKVAKKVY